MKLIVDTHMWYYLGIDNELYNKVKFLPIHPTWVNIVELSRTENVVDKEDYTRSAVQKMFCFKENVIVASPPIYLANLKSNNEDIIVDPFLSSCLDFTERFACGDKIDPNKYKFYYNFVDKHRENVTELCNWFNDKSLEIKLQVNKKEHRKKDTSQITALFINTMVEMITKNKYNLYDFEFDNIELFWKSLDYYFKELELSGMKMQPNDWYDFSQLAYVQPGDMFWTEEKRWKRIIKEVGMESVLFSVD